MDNLWNNVIEQDVLTAIRLFDRNHERYPEPRNTFLLYNDKKYPAKHIRGMAYQVANGRAISKSEYSGGQETANFFKKLGFSVQYKKETLQTKPISKSKDNTSNKQLIGKRLNVVSQKNALQKLLQQHFGVIETEKKFDWLKTPDHNNLPKEYKAVAKALIKYRNQNGFLKSHYQLLCDIVLDDHKMIFEYDEYQHFSKARKITLDNYPLNIELGYSKESWIQACEKINAKDGNPLDRDEKRAFYDTVRDIEAFKHNYTLIRIKHGDVDWEAADAHAHLKKFFTVKKVEVSQIIKHKIARLVVTGKQYDKNGKANFKHLLKVIDKFLAKAYPRQHFEFILTPGGFLTFDFPIKLQYDINITKAEELYLPLFYKEAERVISKFFKELAPEQYLKLAKTVDYFSIGIDGFNPVNYQLIELVGIYDLKKKKVIRWTGKFYPTEGQKRDLVKINDLRTHFMELNHQNIAILGCHDLNVYSPRGQATANPTGWKKKVADKFKEDCKSFNPDIILQHPHTTDTPNIWNLAWRTVEKELPNVKHFASGIKYYNRYGERGEIEKVLSKTKKGDVIDFVFDA